MTLETARKTWPNGGIGIVRFHILIGSMVALAASRMIAVAVALARRKAFFGFAGVGSPCRAADNLETKSAQTRQTSLGKI